MTKAVSVWLYGLFAALISGISGGVLTGLAAIGIEPNHFNLGSGLGHTLKIAAAAAVVNGIIGVFAYLQKSPLPPEAQ